MIRKKLIALIVSLALVVSLSVGGTLAWLNDKSETVTNTFKAGQITTDVKETLDNGVKSNVYITNSTTNENGVDAYIRANVVISWQKKNADGTYSVYAESPKSTDYDITFNLDSQNNGQWVKADDGFYYWTKPVAPGEETGVLISECKLTENPVIPDGYSLCVEIISSGIQTVPTTVVETEWGVTVNADGSISN